MMRTIFMLILFAIAIPAEANSNWNRLWLNPDQRGEALLQQGDASAAAGVYKDPRRKAYAEMKAGKFKQAAIDLGNLHDSDSDYNRGNALAKMGDLKGALDAYDAVLKSDPKNHDAQHNRDLVAQALKKQHQQNKQPQNGQKKNGQPQGNKSGKNANGANSKSGQQSAGNNPSHNSSSTGKSGGKPAGKNSAGQRNAQSSPNENPSTGGKPAQQKNAGQQGSNANSAAQSGQGQSGATADNRQQAATSQSADAAAQARQDAAAGLAANKPGTGGNRIANAAPADKTAPPSEQQLSKAQWLRSIPDDPGGLLRRKFMIEYMLRQQKAQQ